MKAVLLLLMVSCGLFLFPTSVPSAEAMCSRQVEAGSWLPGWLYRKAHNITGSTAGIQVNYPIMITVHHDSGVDFESEVYLHHKCKTDFGDIRFSDSAGNSLDYWMQGKADGDQALFWVEIGYIPQSPDWTTIYVYYGNPNASTTSNKDWAMDFATDFEDGTTQGWSISWHTYVTWDDVSTIAFQGNYSRGAGRQYGKSYAGTGDFYERFGNTPYLAAGSYRLEGAAKTIQSAYIIPKGIKILVDEVSVDSVINPSTGWHYLSGNFTVSTSGFVSLETEFHIGVSYELSNGNHDYYIDSVLVRNWCDPEPGHGSWGIEETFAETSIINVRLEPNPSIVGGIVTLLGNLTTDDNQPISAEKVAVKANGTSFAALTTNSTGWFRASGQVGSAGILNITVEFSGSSQYLGSSTWEILTINKAETSIFAAFTPNPVNSSESCTLKGILVNQFSGPVRFAVVALEYSADYGLTWNSAGLLTTNGYGIFGKVFTAPSEGTYLVKMIYAGSPNYESSTASIPLIVK